MADMAVLWLDIGGGFGAACLRYFDMQTKTRFVGR